MKEKVFAGNQVVFREGDMGESFFLIQEGTAGVYLHYGDPEQRKLTEMKPGQYFGEMAVIEAWPRSTTVVAEEELKVTEIAGSELDEFFTRNPDKILGIMQQIGTRIRELTEEYDEVTAFLKEKQGKLEERSSGFLAKLKKYREINALAKKNPNRLSAEQEIRVQHFDRPKDSPIPVAEYKKGTIIFRQGETGNYMYAVQAGAVGIYTNYGSSIEQKLTTLYANTFFGEMSLLDLEKRSATAVAEEDGTVVEIIRPEELEALFRVNPMEVNMILCHLSNRLRKLTVEYSKACEEAAKEE